MSIRREDFIREFLQLKNVESKLNLKYLEREITKGHFDTYAVDNFTVVECKVVVSLRHLESLDFKMLIDKNQFHYTLLHWCGICGFNRIAELLLKYHTDPGVVCNTNDCLMTAIIGHSTQVAKLIIDSGLCDYNAKNKHGFSALGLAVLYENYEIIELLLGQKSLRKKTIGTAQLLAVDRKDKRILRQFVRNNVNINIGDLKQTTLMRAVHNNCIEMVEFLLELKADPNLLVNDETALSISRRNDCHKIEEILVKSGAIENSSINPISANQEVENIIELLLCEPLNAKYRAYFIALAKYREEVLKTYCSQSALKRAYACKQHDLLHFLVRYTKIEINLSLNRFRQNLLMISIINNDMSMTEKLLKREDLEFEIIDRNLCNCMHYLLGSFYKISDETVKLFLAHRNFNPKLLIQLNIFGSTPLRYSKNLCVVEHFFPKTQNTKLLQSFFHECISNHDMALAIMNSYMTVKRVGMFDKSFKINVSFQIFQRSRDSHLSMQEMLKDNHALLRHPMVEIYLDKRCSCLDVKIISFLIRLIYCTFGILYSSWLNLVINSGEAWKSFYKRFHIEMYFGMFILLQFILLHATKSFHFSKFQLFLYCYCQFSIIFTGFSRSLNDWSSRYISNFNSLLFINCLGLIFSYTGVLLSIQTLSPFIFVIICVLRSLSRYVSILAAITCLFNFALYVFESKTETVEIGNEAFWHSTISLSYFAIAFGFLLSIMLTTTILLEYAVRSCQRIPIIMRDALLIVQIKEYLVAEGILYFLGINSYFNYNQVFTINKLKHKDIEKQLIEFHLLQCH